MHAPPFFIIGSPRSGTTLLRFMLSSHPRLYVPDETGFLPFLNTPPEAILDRTAVVCVLARIGQLNRFWKDSVPDVDAFVEALPERKLADVLDALYRQRIQPHDAVRWGDKTPLYVRYVPYLHRLFPEALFLHVIRDGRDATCSALQKWGAEKPYLDAYYLLKNWVRNVQAGQAAPGVVGAKRYLEVRYEDLVTRPEPVLRGVCGFLREPFDRQMLDPTPLARRVGGGIDEHVEAQDPLHIGGIGRWRQELSGFEQKLADRMAGPLLADLGYERPSQAAFTFSEQAHLGYQAARFAALDGLRSLGYWTGVLTLNRNRKS